MITYSWSDTACSGCTRLGIHMAKGQHLETIMAF
jgi:hypothetical protein